MVLWLGRERPEITRKETSAGSNVFKRQPYTHRKRSKEGPGYTQHQGQPEDQEQAGIYVRGSRERKRNQETAKDYYQVRQGQYAHW